MVFYTICFLLYTSYYGTLFQTYRTFVYLFCVLVYTRGTAPSCPGGLRAWTKPSLLLIKSANNGDGGQSLMIEMLTYVSLLFNWAQFVKICMRPWFRVDCFLKTVHVHCINPELCCTNLTSHWYAVIVETTPKPKTFSSLLLQVNPRNWIQQNLMQSYPKSQRQIIF